MCGRTSDICATNSTAWLWIPGPRYARPGMTGGESFGVTDAAGLPRNDGAPSRHRCGIEQGQIVVDAPAVRPRFGAAARDVEDQLEQLPAGLLDRHLAGGD